MKLLCKTMIGAFSLLFLSFIAKGAGQFDYAGLSIQKNSYDSLDFTPQIETAQLTVLGYEDNLSDTGFRVFIGHQFNDYVALEFGFTSFGHASFTAIEDDSIIKGKFKTFAGDLRVVGTYPINRSLFLKAQVGLLSWDNQSTFLVSDETGKFSTEIKSNKGNSLLTGVGIAYGFNKNLAISFDFEKTEIDKVETENIGISVLLRFN